ncbi:MAG TPA: hypothetical protein VMV18_15545, partial [bacterium]|nr:hypothetical protein [bacterium]
MAERTVQKVIQSAVAAERDRNARWLLGLRVVPAMLDFITSVPDIARGHLSWPQAFDAAYAFIAVTLFLVARRRISWLRLSWLAIPLVDIPYFFTPVFIAIHTGQIDPKVAGLFGASNTLLFVFVGLFSLDWRFIVGTAVLAVGLELAVLLPSHAPGTS